MIETHHFGDITLYIAKIDRGDGEEPRREAERRVTASLISYALGDGVTLTHLPSGAPCLEGCDMSISISHSTHYAAIALAQARQIGIDIEEPRAQLRKVAPRVLSELELEAYSTSGSLLLQAWTLKEALYKAALTPGLDFRRDINLPLPPSSPRATVLNQPYHIITTLTTPTFSLSLVESDLISHL